MGLLGNFMIIIFCVMNVSVGQVLVWCLCYILYRLGYVGGVVLFERLCIGFGRLCLWYR